MFHKYVWETVIDIAKVTMDFSTYYKLQYSTVKIADSSCSKIKLHC